MQQIEDVTKQFDRLVDVLIDGKGDIDLASEQHKALAVQMRAWKAELALEPEPINVVTRIQPP